MIGNTLVNHIMYADDRVILSSAGLQQLLTRCAVSGVEHDITYNARKSAILICRTNKDKILKFPDFKLSDYSGACDKVPTMKVSNVVGCLHKQTFSHANVVCEDVSVQSLLYTTSLHTCGPITKEQDSK